MDMYSEGRGLGDMTVKIKTALKYFVKTNKQTNDHHWNNKTTSCRYISRMARFFKTNHPAEYNQKN